MVLKKKGLSNGVRFLMGLIAGLFFVVVFSPAVFGYLSALLPYGGEENNVGGGRK